MTRRLITYTTAILILVVFLLFCFYPSLAKHYGEHRYFVDSPDKQYHIEILTLPDYYLGAIRMDTPGFVRAYDKNGGLFYESDIFDLYDNYQIT